MKQNYETLDTFSISKDTYIRVSKLLDTNPCHCVVSFYKESGARNSELYTNTLVECYHFIGETAEYDALNYFCSCIPELAEDSPIKSLSECPTYKKELDYVYTPEKKLQEDQNRSEYTQARNSASTRTAHLRRR